jgi:glycosyltransferase involved in cell wall biosynthesis
LIFFNFLFEEILKIPLSIAIISFNEESIIADVLDKVSAIADEIIVVDSFSTDATVTIAHRYNAKVLQKEWTNFTEQKNFALAQCKNDWVLCLDCDEIPTDELIEEIKNVTQNSEFVGYSINRRTNYLGKSMRYAWQPDWNLRLVKKAAHPRWIGNQVHESLIVDGNVTKLKNELQHYSYRNIHHHFTKALNFAKLSAMDYQNQGKKFNLLNLVLNPLLAFFKMYVLKFGFLDGIRGFIASMSSFYGTFMKYAILFEMQINKSINKKE